MGYWPDANHAASWSVTDYLLANLIDCVRELNWTLIKVNANKNAHIKKPDPVYRPGLKQQQAAQRKSSWMDLPRMLGNRTQYLTPQPPNGKAE
jgi:hypothetical protein